MMTNSEHELTRNDSSTTLAIYEACTYLLIYLLKATYRELRLKLIHINYYYCD